VIVRKTAAMGRRTTSKSATPAIEIISVPIVKRTRGFGRGRSGITSRSRWSVLDLRVT
jgi:hypothetical protein